MSGVAGGETSLVARLWRRAAARVKPVIITTVLLLYITVMLVQSGQGGKAGRSAARGQAKIVPVCPILKQCCNRTDIIYCCQIRIDSN